MSENCISVIVVAIPKIYLKINWEAMTEVTFVFVDIFENALRSNAVCKMSENSICSNKITKPMCIFYIRREMMTEVRSFFCIAPTLLDFQDLLPPSRVEVI